MAWDGWSEEEQSMFTIVGVDAFNMVKLKPWMLGEGAETDEDGDAACAEKLETVECLVRTYELKKTAGVKVRHPDWMAVRPIKQDVEVKYERAFAL